MKMNRGIKWTAALVAMVSVLAFSTAAEARPGPHHHGPPPMHHHHHHGGPGFVGALVGTALTVGLIGAIASATEPEPVVVQQPVVYQPAPVVVQQQPATVVQTTAEGQPVQQQVVYQPAPVVYQQPVVYQPARPVVHYHYSSWW